MLAGASLALGAARAADLPRPSPEFAVNLLGGKQVTLGEYRGKAVALIFILTYCPHCQKTIEMLSKLQAEYGPRGFQALGSAIEDMATLALPDFLKRYNPPFPVGYNDRPPVIEYMQHPPMLKLMMPQLVFIDKGGTIRAQFAGDDNKFFGDAQEKNIRAQIEKLLKNGAAPAAPKKAGKK
jgi:peroxiredoxin